MEAATGIVIRPAEVKDAESIHGVFVSAIRAIDDSIYDSAQKKAWEEAVKADSWVTRMLELAFYVAVIDDEIVGFASWSDSKLEHLYVASGFGRRGIASKLMLSVLAHFITRDVELVASNNAAGFYAQFGFIEDEVLIKQLGPVEVGCIRMIRPAV